MRHDEIREQLFALYDGPLTESERKLVDGHLAQCGECRQAVDEWKETASALFPPVVAPEAEEDRFTDAVMQRVRSLPHPERSRRRGFLRWLAPLAGTMAAASATLILFPNSLEMVDDPQAALTAPAPEPAPMRRKAVERHQVVASVPTHREKAPAARVASIPVAGTSRVPAPAPAFQGTYRSSSSPIVPVSFGGGSSARIPGGYAFTTSSFWGPAGSFQGSYPPAALSNPAGKADGKKTVEIFKF